MKYWCYKCKKWQDRKFFSESGIRNQTSNICMECSKAAAKAWHKKKKDENEKYKKFFEF